MSIKACKNCRHWRDNTNFRGDIRQNYKVCNRECNGKDNEMEALSEYDYNYDDGSYPDSVFTSGPDFYCKHFLMQIIT